jgi:hypothetical protein
MSTLEHTEPRYVVEFSHFSLCSAGLRSRAFLENTKRSVLGCPWLRALGLSDQEILAHEFIVWCPRCGVPPAHNFDPLSLVWNIATRLAEVFELKRTYSSCCLRSSSLARARRCGCASFQSISRRSARCRSSQGSTMDQDAARRDLAWPGGVVGGSFWPSSRAPPLGRCDKSSTTFQLISEPSSPWA